MKRELTTLEWMQFNLFIDKMGITNKDIYETILNDFRYGNMTIENFIRLYGGKSV